MAVIVMVSQLGFERVADNGNTVGLAVWSDHRIRPYVRRANGELTPGPAAHETFRAFEYARTGDAEYLANDDFLLAGDLSDNVPDEVA